MAERFKVLKNFRDEFGTLPEVVVYTFCRTLSFIPGLMTKREVIRNLFKKYLHNDLSYRLAPFNGRTLFRNWFTLFIVSL